VHPNAQLIETLYTGLRDGNPNIVAACYTSDAHFEDLAFRLDGRDRIRQMWRLVCSRRVRVSFDTIVADDQTGSGHWIASYIFSDTHRPVVNDITSKFTFHDGLIADHRDESDAWHWARQAYPFPQSLVAGSIEPLRRYKARQKLEQFIRDNPEP
jgi:SnoaL-like domain